MKKFLIIADGKIGHHLVERLIETYTTENIYYIVQPKAGSYPNANPARFKFYEFDPTSFYKLSNLLKMDFVQAIISMDSAVDVDNTVKNIRSVKKQLRTIVLDQFDMDFDDANLVQINSNELLASRLIDYLPNVPVIAQNVGMGEGEVMEVLVPFGSSFVYRHIGVIEQKNWRIVGIYRNRKLILPNRRTMIQPNDLLLLVGQPPVLKSVYRAIKRELGQFPAPFGTNLYLLIDMAKQSTKQILSLMEQALFIHDHFSSDLMVKVVNPCNIELLSKIKEHRNGRIDIEIDYYNRDVETLLHHDITTYHIGLVMVGRELFTDRMIRQVLYEGNVPVLSIAGQSFEKLKEAVVVLSENRDLEKVSTTIFDISAQMRLNLELLSYLQEHNEEKEEVLEHFKNLSTIFSKSIKISEVEENPIRYLRKKENFLYCLPFSEKMIERPIMSLFSTDSERLYHRLGNYHQLYIPVQI
ncbi:MAG: TrkA C-terminal domain-containing protein [Sulfurimonadaceae bacterium]|nr:TrkA C-terminal domain-containing protein [Sulfurimonadaceae bacterium]